MSEDLDDGFDSGTRHNDYDFHQWFLGRIASEDGEYDLDRYEDAAEGWDAAKEHDRQKIKALEAQLAELQQAPDYKRVKRALDLANCEYLGQEWLPLWEWAWKESALEDKGDE